MSWSLVFVVNSILLGVGLAMDAFSVSVCGSLALRPAFRLREAIRFGAWFGGFQLLMPMIGYWAAYRVRSYIESFDHWIAFFLLLYIGINMIREGGGRMPGEYGKLQLFSDGSFIPGYQH